MPVAQHGPFGGIYRGLVCSWATFWAGSVSNGRNSALEPCEALEVIDEVGHADLDGGSGDTDGPHDEPHAMFLPGEHMLDMGTDFGSSCVGLGDPLGQ